MRSTEAIGYVRVSTAMQGEDGISPEAQRAKIKSYCELHNLTLVRICEDHLSGKRADNRPGLQEALSCVCKLNGTLVVYSLSRLARNTRDCLDIADKLNKCGSQLSSIVENIDTNTVMGEFVYTLMSALSQLERKQIGERTKMALGHKRSKGERISRSVFGYDMVDDRLVVNVDEQPILEEIIARRCAGDGLDVIATSLNDRGIKPKYGVRWYASSVRSVIKSSERRKLCLT